MNDIPGNRPEDEAEELFYEKLDQQFVAEYGDRAKKWLTLLEDIDPEDMIYEYIGVARRIAAQDAVDQYRTELGQAFHYEREKSDS